MTFAKRLVAGTLLVLFFTIGVLVWTAERTLRDDLRADLARTLEREARLIHGSLPADSARWAVVVRRVAVADGTRVTVLDPAGRVLADSDQPAAAGRTSFAAMPEVRDALRGGTGSAVRPAAEGESPSLFVAVPVDGGMVRIASGLGQVEATMARSRSAILGAAALALVFGSVLAYFAGQSIAQPLTALGAAARAIAGGSLPRFPRSGVPEIDALVQALRQMHRQLADRFDELRGEQAQSTALVETMVEGVIAADGRGHIETANPAARRLLGYGERDPLPDLRALFRAKAAREVVDAVLQGVSIQNRQLDLDGRVILVNARPLVAGGAVLVLHDLTEVRRLEAVRRDFVANVSHELKTPLTSISGYAETLLGDPPDTATTRRFVETILSNARRMQRLVDDLLDLSRIESGRWQPRPEQVELAAVVDEVRSELDDRAAQRGVRIEADLGADAATVFADPEALRQVLVNLVDNSVRYAPRGGRVTCRSRRDGAGTLVSVVDDGTGIAREHLARIFERFYRADPSRSRDEGGTGLGLAIVKHLVEAHGGRATAESERGRGTAVHCWFPDA